MVNTNVAPRRSARIAAQDVTRANVSSAPAASKSAATTTAKTRRKRKITHRRNAGQLPPRATSTAPVHTATAIQAAKKPSRAAPQAGRKRKADDLLTAPVAKRQRQDVDEHAFEATATACKRASSTKKSGAPKGARQTQQQAPTARAEADATVQSQTLATTPPITRASKRKRAATDDEAMVSPVGDIASSTTRPVAKKAGRAAPKKDSPSATAPPLEPLQMTTQPAEHANEHEFNSTTTRDAQHGLLVDRLLSEIRAKRMMQAFKSELENLNVQIEVCEKGKAGIEGIEEAIKEKQDLEDTDNEGYFVLIKNLAKLKSATLLCRARRAELEPVVDAFSRSSLDPAGVLIDIGARSLEGTQLAGFPDEFGEQCRAIATQAEEIDTLQRELSVLSAKIVSSRDLMAANYATLFSQGLMPTTPTFTCRSIDLQASGDADAAIDLLQSAPGELGSIARIAAEAARVAHRRDMIKNRQSATELAAFLLAEHVLVRAGRLEANIDNSLDSLPTLPAQDSTEVQSAVVNAQGKTQPASSSQEEEDTEYTSEFDEELPPSPQEVHPRYWRYGPAENAYHAKALSEALEEVLAADCKEDMETADDEVARAHQMLESLRAGRIEYLEGISERGKAAAKRIAEKAAEVAVRKAQATRAKLAEQMRLAEIAEVDDTDSNAASDCDTNLDCMSFTGQELIDRLSGNRVKVTSIERWVHDVNAVEVAVEELQWGEETFTPPGKVTGLVSEPRVYTIRPMPEDRFTAESIPACASAIGGADAEYIVGKNEILREIQRQWAVAVVLDAVGNIIEIREEEHFEIAASKRGCSDSHPSQCRSVHAVLSDARYRPPYIAGLLAPSSAT